MTEEQTISLRDLRAHIRALDELVTTAWMNTASPAEISFDEVREHARSILVMVGEETPTAEDNEKKADVLKRAAYQRAAADEAPAFDLPAILGLSHIRKGPRS